MSTSSSLSVPIDIASILPPIHTAQGVVKLVAGVNTIAHNLNLIDSPIGEIEVRNVNSGRAVEVRATNYTPNTFDIILAVDEADDSIVTFNGAEQVSTLIKI